MNTFYKYSHQLLGKIATLWIAVFLLTAFIVGCGGGTDSGSDSESSNSDVNTTVPIDGEADVSLNRNITINFNQTLDTAANAREVSQLPPGEITLTGPDSTPIEGVLSYIGSVGTFTPTVPLTANTKYTVTITNSANQKHIWTFTTGVTVALGPEPVNLGTSDGFVILSKTGITTTGTTEIVGSIGASPIAETAITGFSQARDATNQFSTAAIVTGKIYASDMAAPTPANLTTAISDMQTAYTDAAGRTLPDFTELGAGDISGLTLVPGLYKWGSGLLISSDIALSGGAHDVWIFQIAQNLTVGNGVNIILSGGAQAKNIFWQVTGQTILGTTTDFKGIILSKTLISIATGAVVNGRALSQTAVTLNANAITQPGGALPDTTAPTVSQTFPENNTSEMATNGAITATFSETMDAGTLSDSIFTLKQGSTAVSGTVTYVGNTASFKPSSNLASNTTYTAAISTGAKDLIGNALVETYNWSFTTGVAPDTAAPTVSLTSPANNATEIAINGSITATFNETMDAGTLSNASFTLQQGTTAVSGTVTYTGTTVKFKPSSLLNFSTIYTATVTTDAKDVAGNALAQSYTWSLSTGAVHDITAPTVSLTSPANNATGIASNGAITATFVETMDSETFSTSSFTLKQGTIAVSGTVSSIGTTAKFKPLNNLAFSTLYTASVTTGAKDVAGNALAQSYSWSFTTGAAPDTTAPTVSLTSPASNATGIAINGAVTATFNETMDTGTLSTSTLTLKQGSTAVSGTVTYIGTTAKFKPLSDLAFSTLYAATITTGAKDVAGNALAESYSWSFTTGAAPDTTAPTVSQTSPVNNTTGILVNRAITATFNETMDTETVSTSTLTLKQGSTAVSGTVTYIGNTTTFKPLSDLAFSTLYTVTVTTGAKDVAGNALAESYSWSFTTGAAPDTTAPTVSLTSPANNATGIASNGAITVTFNETMDTETLSNSTLTLKQGSTAVSGTVTYIGTTATFKPSSDLAFSTLYTVAISTSVKDAAGNALAQSYSWSFTTGAAPDTTAPTVSQTSPANDATEVASNGAISVTFNESMDTTTLSTSTFTLKEGTTAVSGTVTYTGTTATFKPSSDLAFSTLYTAAISTSAKDVAGNALAESYSLSFTTGAAPDTTAPTVSLTSPVSNATGIAINGAITVTFDETMDPATITTATFVVTLPDLTSVAGTVTYLSRTATFKPTSNLEANTLYTVTIKTEVTDLAIPANALTANFVFSFTTSAATALGPATVNLGTAGNFVILAKSAVSTTGTTAITGNVGVSPAAETFITGFSQARDATNQFSTAGIVTGKIYAANMAVPTPADMTTAISDMETAYTDAAGRTLPDFTELGAGDISGLTLVPGLYKWGTGVLAASNVTISGGANDIWIFQVAQDLTVSSAVIITLSGGAQSKNIFWQVAGQVNLGTTADFKGIILSQTQIVLNTGAVMNGRLLAQTAITLDANAVTQPTN